MGHSTYSGILQGTALLGICVLSFSIRLFSVIKYESVIHEFDPYFNYRVTQFLTENGFYEMWNWFDIMSWYPLGRVVGGTVYPGLIWTAGLMYKALHALNIPIHVQEVCVFTAPVFSALSALAACGLMSEIKSSGAGLLAALFVGIVPSYISRSVAGSYDNEGVAIFALIFVFYLFVKTLNTGSLAWAVALSGAYGYMVLCWGGYSFIINLLPIHCLVSLATGRLSSRLYVAYSPLIVYGTLLAASVPVIGFNAILMSEHFGAFLAFLALHTALLLSFIRRVLPPREYASAKLLILASGALAGSALAVVVALYMLTSPTFGWTGRSLSLLDPTYAAKYIPIIASVSEHQPPAWNSYFMDIHAMVLLMPVGLVFCFRPLTDGSLFLVLYGLTAVYFSGVMVRLMLVLAPAACCLAALAVSELLDACWAGICAREIALAAATSALPLKPVDASTPALPKGKVDKKAKKGALSASASSASLTGGADASPLLDQSGAVAAVEASLRGEAMSKHMNGGVAWAALAGIAALMTFYAMHCVWVSAEMYSAPSIVLQTRNPATGDVSVFDDFREAYAWLRFNTKEDAKVASWWDYGYQTTAMANRTVIVDNNTWNNTHIATVGRAFASPEAKAWQIYRDLDVEYVLVVFGGLIGYPSDDINKFLWMVRIGGGVFDDVKEKDFIGSAGYTVDRHMSPAMRESIMYKLSYYRFAEVSKGGSDRVRKYEIGQPEIKLQYFEEVFTSEYWMTRIYRVLPEPPRQRAVPYTPAQAVDRVKPKTRSTSKRRDVSGQLARQAPS